MDSGQRIKVTAILQGGRGVRTEADNFPFISAEIIEVGLYINCKNTAPADKVENEKGEKIELEEPEELHTYRGWQELRRQVKKGEKAVATFLIWKHTVKKTEEDEEKEKMFMTKAFFFTVGQTETIKEEK